MRDPEKRSLMQKAIRRGDVALAQSTARWLLVNDSHQWVFNRVQIIGFEECWPLAGNAVRIAGEQSLMEFIALITNAAKCKDACGVGSMADAWIGGATPPISKEVKIVRAAIERPNDFWAWAGTHGDKAIVSAARHVTWQKGFSWDMAFAFAGAYLSTVHVPAVNHAEAVPCPMWVAQDRHTPRGKAALRNVAAHMRVPYAHIEWAQFYCESALVNGDGSSPWFTAEAEWRLGTVGLTLEKARAVWEIAAPLMQAAL